MSTMTSDPQRWPGEWGSDPMFATIVEAIPDLPRNWGLTPSSPQRGKNRSDGGDEEEVQIQARVRMDVRVYARMGEGCAGRDQRGQAREQPEGVIHVLILP